MESARRGVSHVLNEDIVGSWLDGYAIIAPLIYHVGQHDVVGVHRVEAVCVLHPVRAIWCLYCRGIAEYVVKPHVLAVHDVQRPERRVLDIDWGFSC